MAKMIKVRALKTNQGRAIDLYSFFLPGSEIAQIAQISRIQRNISHTLEGFQRKEIKDHVKRIVEYLNTGEVLFPNAILLAMSSEVTFKQSRGPKPRDVIWTGTPGILEIPIFSAGAPVAWIVDGQQRSLALQKADNADLPVPIVAFVSDDIEVQREQFVLVNKAKPLPSRLIHELLPTIPEISIPRDLAPRRIPSNLCSFLNQDCGSPFFKLIRQVSNEDSDAVVIVDTAIINVISKSLNSPLGALAPYKTSKDGGADVQQMYRILCLFWTEVKAAFPEAWGLPPTKSRLMHSAGIEAMGAYMDKVLARTVVSSNPPEEIRKSLEVIRPFCKWINGTWEGLGMRWNEIENTPKHIKMLADYLIHLDFQAQCQQ